MPQRRIKQLPADVLADEFGREKASALGRLGCALEAALAALAEFDAGHSHQSCAAEDRQLRASLVAERASRCGISWYSARPAGCGTYATFCAITACRRRSPRAWARCRRNRFDRASRLANHSA